MSEEVKKKKKYTKIGNIWEGKFGPYAQLGDNKNKNQDYNFDVKIMVKNAKGDKVLDVVNGAIQLQDPRKRPVKEGQKPRNVPESLKYELVIVTEE